MAPIEQLTVSPSGTSYAIQLNDNSVMVLSTSELKPTTNIPGLQAETFSRSGKHGDINQLSNCTHGTVDPLNSNRVMITIPSLQGMDAPSMSYLQHFDISTSRHIARQALTRNNVTNFIDTPSRNLLLEPNVTLMEISLDGCWMATVEEWTPPNSDTEYLAYDDESEFQNREARREVYLKFWRRSNPDALWSLETRIDAPHVDENSFPTHVYSITAHPIDERFATIGGDGFVRIWMPKTLFSNGTIIRGVKNGGTIVWSNRTSIQLEQVIESLDADYQPASNAPVYAALAYSQDGSVLTASQVLPNGQAAGVVHIIDAETGNIQYSIPGLWDSGLTAMAIIDRHLIVLSNSLCVWDIVTDTLVYSIDINEMENESQWRACFSVNNAEKTFLVAVPDIVKEPQSYRSNIMVFKSSEPQPIYTTSIDTLTLSVMAMRDRLGFVILDSAAEIRTLTSPSSMGIPFLSQVAAAKNGEVLDSTFAAHDVEKEPVDLNVDMDADELSEGDVTEGVQAVEAMDEDDEIEDTENDKPIVRPEQLEELFASAPLYGMMPVKDIFDGVVGLYARKTKVY
jgi:NET1-associated nuclear protein 1 (U3 small nucleolar RNA-associated protein 17)